MQHPPTNDIEVRDFDSLRQWEEWFHGNPGCRDPETLLSIVKFTEGNGLIEPLTGRRVGPDEVRCDHDSLRESGFAIGLSSRYRALLLALQSCPVELHRDHTKIYAAEAISELAMLLRGRYAKFIGSEFTTNPAIAAEFYPIQIEDLTRLSLNSAAFDVVITSEVLEHVPDLDAALREIARVLRPGGWHVGTCPFLCMQNESIVKARIIDGQIEYLCQPEYHGNPVDPGGSLVYELPGWGILDRAKAAGFSQAFWKYVRSKPHGIASEATGGVFVLCLQA